ncbi:hypothetical protein HYFRA_00007480 [Hymenoscyphus fraxineus]|uniref:Uncharacterized protein n=1 Tax=Hymenoscyphus fraxineus TaxID=746836 RepID=A0A9N9KQD5_9HELO|nr:hypothetical protein HYFRA_00007480 [Hymenoscyphus fraxineus]
MHFPLILFIASLAISTMAQIYGMKAICKDKDGFFDFTATKRACKLYKGTKTCCDCKFWKASKFGDAHCESEKLNIEVSQWDTLCRDGGGASGFIYALY